MPLLLEAFCVYIKLESIHSNFIGGVEAFDNTVDTIMYSHDDYIFSCAFKTYNEAQEYYELLLTFGLTNEDIAIASQAEGILTDTAWLKTSSVTFNTGKQVATVAVISHKDDSSTRFSTPKEWLYEGSLSEDCITLTNDSEKLFNRDGENKAASLDGPFIKEYCYPDEFEDNLDRPI